LVKGKIAGKVPVDQKHHSLSFVVNNTVVKSSLPKFARLRIRVEGSTS
jgi:hypothetical protein